MKEKEIDRLNILKQEEKNYMKEMLNIFAE